MASRLEGSGNTGEDGALRDNAGRSNPGNSLLENNRVSQAAAAQQRQRTQMLLALALLAIALIVVLIKDRQFWLGASPPAEQAAEQTTEQSQAAAPDSAQGNAAPEKTTTSAPAHTAPVERSTRRARPAIAPHNPPAHTHEQMSPSIVASNRAALPPLEVEVVAGGQRQTIQASSPTVHVDMQSGARPVPAPVAATTPPQAPPAANSTAAGRATVSERVSMSAATSEVVERPVEPNYPMLAKQMKVQGSVILQALIGREGSIQDLRVLSGPAILSTAAMDAVRQWHFRPYYQSGQAIETEARITVNFTISTY